MIVQNIDYYNQNADSYFAKSVDVDMSVFRGKFLEYLPEGGRILDVGCGSGRDSKEFLSAGYDVTSFDASEEMCRRASDYIGRTVYNLRFDQIAYKQEFDGVWACASLNHESADELPGVMKKMAAALKPGGAIFATFRYGEGVSDRDGRVYCDFTRESIEPLFVNAGFNIVSVWGGNAVQSDKYIGSWIIVIALNRGDDVETSLKLTIDQERALKVMRSGRNVFLSGSAGTGKSYLISEYIKENKDKNVIVCAPTGLAAENIGGGTLNRLFYIPMGCNKVGDFSEKPRNAVRQADIIIIDEISMCRIDVFEYVIRTIRNISKQKKKENDNSHMHKQVILVGDFYQLPPVLKTEDESAFEAEWGLRRGEDLFAYNSSLWDDLSLVNIILKTQVRQDPDFEYLENLNKIRIGDPTGIDWFNLNVQRTPIPDAIYICPRKDEAERINNASGDSIPGDYTVYEAVIDGKANLTECPMDQELKLKCGMRAMTLVNSGNDYQNGALGYITKLAKDYIELKLLSGKNVRVYAYTWNSFEYQLKDDKVEKVQNGSIKQFPIKVAYAITIHKAQGQTFSAVNISPKCFDRGQLYVALSRVKRVENMSISCDIKKEYLRSSKAVFDFYDDLDDELLGWEFDEHKWDSNSVDTMTEESSDDDETLIKNIEKVIAKSYLDWTDEEDEQLKEEMLRGLSIKDISILHGRTIGAIRARIISTIGEDL